MSEEKTPSAESEVFEFPAKEAQSEHYELLLLILGDFTEEQSASIYAEAKELITAAGGQITLENPMGRRNLAYPVKNVHTGTYYAVEFDLEKSALAIVHEKLRIRKDVARFMIVKKATLTQEAKDAYEEMRAHLVSEGKEVKLKKIEEEEKKRKPRRKPLADKQDDAPVEKKEAAVVPTEEDVDKGIDKVLSDDLDV